MPVIRNIRDTRTATQRKADKEVFDLVEKGAFFDLSSPLPRASKANRKKRPEHEEQYTTIEHLLGYFATPLDCLESSTRSVAS